MKATAQERHPLRLWFILFLIVGIALMSYIPLNNHALEKHGAHAVEAVRCLDQNGETFHMLDPKAQRIAKVCQDPSQEYGWYIIIVCAISGCCITAFKRERAKKRYEVEDYLRGNGFKRQ